MGSVPTIIHSQIRSSPATELHEVGTGADLDTLIEKMTLSMHNAKIWKIEWMQYITLPDTSTPAAFLTSQFTT